MYRRIRTTALAAVTVLVAASAAGAQTQGDKDYAEINRYRLTAAGLKKFEQASRNLVETVNTDPSIPNDMKKNEKANASLADMAAIYDSHPKIKRALNSAGMTSREYVTFMMAMFQAGMASWAAKQPGAKLPVEISRENIAFYDAHEADLKRIGDELKKLDKTSSDDDDEEEVEIEEEDEDEAEDPPSRR